MMGPSPMFIVVMPKKEGARLIKYMPGGDRDAYPPAIVYFPYVDYVHKL
jgi:hypothetical protein